MDKLIIGLHGKRRVGKDTFANCLVCDYGFTKIAFADPLREACAAVWDNQTVFFEDYENLKDTNLASLAVVNTMKSSPDLQSGFCLYCNDNNFDIGMPRSPRWVLQNYSDFAKSKAGTDVWMERWLIKAKSCGTNIVVPDVRYTSEAAFLRNMSGFMGIVEIFRKGLQEDPTHNHSSDVRIDQRFIDDQLLNQTTQAIFESCTKLCFEELLDKYNRKQQLKKGE